MFDVPRPPVGVAWRSEWDPRGSGYAIDKRAVFAGAGVWMRAPRGEVARVVIEPGDQWVGALELVAGAEVRREARARGVVVAFAREHGARVEMSTARRIAPTEYAVEVHGVAPFGKPGASLVWADESPGEGRVEVETQSAELAARIFAWAEAGAVASLEEVVQGGQNGP